MRKLKARERQSLQQAHRGRRREGLGRLGWGSRDQSQVEPESGGEAPSSPPGEDQRTVGQDAHLSQLLEGLLGIFLEEKIRIRNLKAGWVWWLMPVIQALWRPRQEDHLRPRPATATPCLYKKK